MAERLTGAEGLCAALIFSKTVHPADEYLTLFRAGEREDDEEEEWRPTSVTSLSVTVCSLAAASPPGHFGLWDVYVYHAFSSPVPTSRLQF